MTARLVFVCTTQPMIGYANNLDFFRQSACVGVWQVFPGQDRISAHVESPSDDLVRDGTRIDELCMASSDNVFVWAVGHLHPKGAHFPLREVGAAKMLLTLALAALTLLQPIGTPARLASAFVMLLVFGDIAVACYFNTLYVDASGIIAATLSALGSVALCARKKPPNWASLALVAGSVLWLGTTKPQYEFLAILLGVIDAFILLRLWRDVPKACVIAVLGLAGPLMLNSLNAAPENIMRSVAEVNRADTMLQAVLPAARDTAKALAMLGLPPSCASAIGRNGNDKDVQTGRICPELRQVSRFRLLPLFLHDPGTFLTPYFTGIKSARPSLPAYLHPFALLGPSRSVAVDLIVQSSLSTQLTYLLRLPYRGLVFSVLGFGWVGFLLLLHKIARRDRLGVPPAALALLGLGGLDYAYAIASAVFGDGYMEPGRHEVLTLVGISLFLSGLLWSIGAYLTRWPVCWFKPHIEAGAGGHHVPCSLARRLAAVPDRARLRG